MQTKPSTIKKASLLAVCAAAIGSSLVLAGDWPMWGHDPSHNMVSSEKNLPTTVDPGKAKDDGTVDPATTKNVKWTAKLGSASYGNATVANGRVFVGTNNASPRDPKYQGDYGNLYCLDEKTGKLLWQLAVPKLAAGKAIDYEQVGLCSSPTVDGDHVYVVTSRCEVVCLDVHGQAAGANRGSFTDEAQYTAGPGKPPIPQGPNDADIIWRYDMREELGSFPKNQASSAILVVGDKLFVTTSNGVDWTGKHIPSPDCPALICLDKNTGKLLAVERSGISRRTWVCNWSSPSYGVIAGRPTVVFGAGDGYCYGFDADINPAAPAEQKPDTASSGGSPATLRLPVPTLKELWRFDCNPPERHTRNGKPQKYGTPDGPSDVIATPVVYNDRVYIAVGQEPDQGDGAGAMNCIDPKARHWRHFRHGPRLDQLAGGPIAVDGLHLRRIGLSRRHGRTRPLSRYRHRPGNLEPRHREPHLGLDAGGRWEDLHRQRERAIDDPGGREEEAARHRRPEGSDLFVADRSQRRVVHRNGDQLYALEARMKSLAIL